MARVIAVKDQKAKTINQNWVWKEFDFDKVFGSKPCLICMTHHPTHVSGPICSKTGRSNSAEHV